MKLNFFKSKGTTSSIPVVRNDDTKEKAKSIIKEIHKEFDSAEDRLLEQAKEILNKNPIILTAQVQENQKARRLKALGFVNTEEVKSEQKRLSEAEQERKIIEAKNSGIKTIEEFASIIEEYKREYPFQKFLTIDELNRICRKYNLIYAPVANFKSTVPEKNLLEIENAKVLYQRFTIQDQIVVEITEFWDNTPSSLIDFIHKNPIINYKPIGYEERYDEISEENLKRHIKEMGYTGIFGPYIFKKANKTIERKSGLFIVAPKSDFILDDLTATNKFGYAVINTEVVEDPIVFRYCKGGIQVITKWGLEASDPILINEIEN